MPLLYSERSLDFDGTGERIAIGDVAELSFERTDAFTLSGWMRTAVSSTQAIFCKKLASAPLTGWFFGVSSGQLTFSMTSSVPNDLSVVSTNVNLDDNKWYHVCVTYDGSSTAAGATLYVDGEELAVSVTFDNLGGSILTVAGAAIGTRSTTSTTLSFDGRLAELAVYDKELTAGEVTTIYNAGSPPNLLSVGPTINLIGYWRPGEHSFPTVPDLSPSGNDGTMTNMAADDIVVDAPRPYEAFYSLLHDFAGNEYVTMGDLAPFEFGVANSFSISTWVKFSKATTLSGYLVSKIIVGTTRGWGLYEETGDLLFLFQGSGGWSRIRTTGGDYRTGEWRHVVLTYGGTSNAAGMNIYVDGILQTDTTENDSLGGTTANTASLNLMTRTDGSFSLLGGAQTETTIWTKELTPSEVTSLYNGGQPKDARTYGWNSTLLGYWSPNPQSFPTVPDLTGNGYNGTATNMEASDVKLDAPGVDFSDTVIGALSCDWGGNQNIVGWVDLGTPSQLAFERTQAFSLSLWVKYTGGGTLISNMTPDATFRGWELYIDPPYGDFNFWMASDDGAVNKFYAYTDLRYDDDQWHHLVLTYAGDSDANNLRFYVDGVSVPFTVDSNALTGTTVSAENVRLGKTASEDISYDGSMDEVSIWSRVLTEVEARTLYGRRGPSDLLENMPLANLVGYWKMGDGDTFPTLLDYGPYGIDGTMSRYLHTHRIVNERPPSAPSTQYSLGNGGRYDATSTLFDFGKADPFSLTMWFRTDSPSTSYPSMASHSASLGFILEVQGDVAENPGGISMNFYGPTTTIRSSTDTAYNDANWHHLVVTYDGTGVGTGIVFYVDGALSASTVHEDTLGVEDFYEATPYRIYDAIISGSGGYIGETCQHAVYDKALSAGEVTAIYAGGTQPDLTSVGPTANLVAWWPILDTDLPNLPTVADAGPNDIPMVSFTTAETIVPASPEPLVSTYSIVFDGVDDYVEIGDVSTLSFERTNPFSIIFWMKGTPQDNDAALISKLSGVSPFPGWEINTTSSSGAARFYLFNNSASNRIDVYGGPALYDGYWHCVCYTYDGSSSAAGVRLFVEGTERPLTIVGNNLSATTVNAIPVRFGIRGGGGSPYAGSLDEIAIYNRVLSPSEVLLLGAQLAAVDYGAVGPVDALIGWWRMGDTGPGVYPFIGDRAVVVQNTGTMTNMDSGDIVLSSPAVFLTSFALYSYGALVTGPGTESVTETADYDFVTFTPVLFFKMRALADPGPGYVTWNTSNIPDYVGTFAPTAIQASTVILADRWTADQTFESSFMKDLSFSTVSSPVLLVAPQYGVLFVGVDTSQGTWNAFDTITLPAAPSKGVEIILKDIGGQADTKQITVSGNGNNISGSPSSLIDSAQGSLHLVFSGTQWSSI